MKFACFLPCFWFAFQSVNAQTPSTTPIAPIKTTCHYSLTYQPDSTAQNNKTSVFLLVSDGKSSIFKEAQTLKRDSLLQVYQALPMNEHNLNLFMTQVRQLPPSDFSFSIYKNYASKEIIFADRIDKATYYYPEPDGFAFWRITQDEKEISGYSCRKATTDFGGRTWEAWFTREIPLADGPYKFYGLPGLIVQANDTRNQYVFSLQKISRGASATSVQIPVTHTIKTAKAVFVQAKKIYVLGAPNRLATKGINVPEERIQVYKDRLKKQNNPLELD